MGDQTTVVDIAQSGVVGGHKMLLGSLIAGVSTLMTFLAEHSHEIGSICMLIGTGMGIVGFAQNRKVVFARERRERAKEKREQLEHDARMSRRETDMGAG